MAKPASNLQKQINQVEKEINTGKEKLSKLRHQLPKEEVANSVFKDHQGKSVKLSDLFGKKKELILVHNMGKQRPYCTLWADGFNGLVGHFENRAAFVLESADDVNIQKKFHQGRKWKFKMVSSHGTSFKKDMGFLDSNDHPMPGVSIFQKVSNGKIYRTAQDGFGPGDDYCSFWHFFDRLPCGVRGVKP